MNGGRALRDGLVVAGLLFAGYLFLVVAPGAGTVGFDAFAYWSVDPTEPYDRVAGQLGAFTYTPVAVRLFAPAALGSWPDFWFAWTAVLLGTVAWLGGRRSILVVAFPPVALELYHGNVHLLIAAAIALGFRYPAAWAMPVLTKVTPGIGLIWFAVRREWRSLAVALGVTGVLVVVSLVVDGPLWIAWWEVSTSQLGDPGGIQPDLPLPLWLRLPVAAALVAWGARTDRRWTVPAAAVLAMPILWPSTFAVLAAIPALSRPQLREGSAPRRPR